MRNASEEMEVILKYTILLIFHYTFLLNTLHSFMQCRVFQCTSA